MPHYIGGTRRPNEAHAPPVGSAATPLLAALARLAVLEAGASGARGGRAPAACTAALELRGQREGAGGVS